MARIAVVGGAGYVGLTYAAALVELGHDVVGLDLDADKVRLLGEGRSPIFEPGLEELIQKGLASGRLAFTTEYAQAVPDAEFCFVCVGTPSDASGRADMQYVAAAAAQIGAHGRGHTIVVNKSTLPVGSARFVLEILAEHARPGATFAVVSNPEFLREGCALRDIFQPDRIVLGADDEADARRVAELYGPLHAPVVITDPRSAEMVKYASNAFLASKISFVNEVALICERLGADISVVAEGMGLDERIGRRFLQAGAGFGGSCFPKDVKALASMARDAGLDPSLLNAVLGINNTMRRHVVQRVADRLGGLAGKSVALLGLAFKPDTDDTREAPALAVIRQLLVGEARVRATDPVAMPHVAAQLPQVALLPDPFAAATGADAVVLMTEWAEYRALDLDRLANAMRGRLLVDARNAIAPAAARAAGLEYVGIGRAPVAEAALPRVSAVISRPHPAPVEDVAVQPTAMFAAD